MKDYLKVFYGIVFIFCSSAVFGNEYDEYLKRIDLSRLSEKERKEVMDAVNSEVTDAQLAKSEASFVAYVKKQSQLTEKDKNEFKKISESISFILGEKVGSNSIAGGYKMKASKPSKGKVANLRKPVAAKTAIKMNENNLTSSNIFTVHSEVYRLISKAIK